MEMQTRGVLLRVQQKLKNAGFELADIVKRNVLLVAEEVHGNKPDLAGFGRAMQNFFTEQQPILHARTRDEVVRLMNPAG